MSNATEIRQKEQKETTKEGGLSSTIMDQKSIDNSANKPQRSPNEALGFKHGRNQYCMCNETGIPELLESRILGIPVVAIVMSRTRSLRDPTQQDFIHACTLPIYMCHTQFKF